jgi:hypothetical protein
LASNEMALLAAAGHPFAASRLCFLDSQDGWLRRSFDRSLALVH